MRKVERPIRQHLQDDDHAALVARVWQRLDLREARPQRLRWMAAGALLLIVASGAILGLYDRHRSAVARLPLMLRSDQPLGLLEAPATESARLPMSDGSEILLSPGASLKTLQNDSGIIELALRRGRAELEVRPGGSRRWIIDSDLLSVEVVGTHFSVTRDERGVEVAVSRGVVLVRGERVPEHVQRLTAGQSLRVDAPSPPAEVSSVPTVPSVPPPSPAARPSPAEQPRAPTPVEPASAPAPTTNVAPTTGAAPTTGPAPTTSAAEPPAIARSLRASAPRPVAASSSTSVLVGAPARPPSPTELLDQVDAARRAGKLDQAIAMLQRLAYDGDRSPAAAIAAFTLGRVLLDEPANPAHATRAFERALYLGLPAGLSADAISLCRESLMRASGAHSAAEIPHDRCR